MLLRNVLLEPLEEGGKQRFYGASACQLHITDNFTFEEKC